MCFVVVCFRETTNDDKIENRPRRHSFIMWQSILKRMGVREAEVCRIC